MGGSACLSVCLWDGVGGEEKTQRALVESMENRFIDLLARERLRFRGQLEAEVQRQLSEMQSVSTTATGAQESGSVLRDVKTKGIENEKEGGLAPEGTSGKEAKRAPEGAPEGERADKAAKIPSTETKDLGLQKCASPQKAGMGEAVVTSPMDDPYYDEECDSAIELSYDIDESGENELKRERAEEQHLQFLGISVVEGDEGENKGESTGGKGARSLNPEVSPDQFQPSYTKGGLTAQERPGIALLVPSTARIRREDPVEWGDGFCIEAAMPKAGGSKGGGKGSGQADAPRVRRDSGAVAIEGIGWSEWNLFRRCMGSEYTEQIVLSAKKGGYSGKAEPLRATAARGVPIETSGQSGKTNLGKGNLFEAKSSGIIVSGKGTIILNPAGKMGSPLQKKTSKGGQGQYDRTLRTKAVESHDGKGLGKNPSQTAPVLSVPKGNKGKMAQTKGGGQVETISRQTVQLPLSKGKKPVCPSLVNATDPQVTAKNYFCEPPVDLNELCNSNIKTDPSIRTKLLSVIESHPTDLRIMISRWVTQFLQVEHTTAKRVSHMLYNFLGIRAMECIALFDASDFTDFVVRASGLFPNPSSAHSYERECLARGLTKQQAKHPYAKSPAFLSHGTSDPKASGVETPLGERPGARPLSSSANACSHRGPEEPASGSRPGETQDVKGGKGTRAYPRNIKIVRTIQRMYEKPSGADRTAMSGADQATKTLGKWGGQMCLPVYFSGGDNGPVEAREKNASEQKKGGMGLKGKELHTGEELTGPPETLTIQPTEKENKNDQEEGVILGDHEEKTVKEGGGKGILCSPDPAAKDWIKNNPCRGGKAENKSQEDRQMTGENPEKGPGEGGQCLPQIDIRAFEVPPAMPVPPKGFPPLPRIWDSLPEKLQGAANAVGPSVPIPPPTVPSSRQQWRNTKKKTDLVTLDTPSQSGGVLGEKGANKEVQEVKLPRQTIANTISRQLTEEQREEGASSSDKHGVEAEVTTEMANKLPPPPHASNTTETLPTVGITESSKEGEDQLQHSQRSRGKKSQAPMVRNYARLPGPEETPLILDPAEEFEIQLKAPVQLSALAGVHGVDFEALEAAAGKNDDTSACLEAKAEIKTLETMKGYLTTARGAVGRAGNIFTIHVRKIPTRLLEVEKRRLRVLLRGGHVTKYNYTNPARTDMIRCCLPGCGGAVLNLTKIRYSIGPHCRAFHHHPDLVLVFHYEVRRGWDMLCIPAPPAGTPPPGYTTPGKGVGIGNREEGEDQAPVGSGVLDIQLTQYEGNLGPNMPSRMKTRGRPKGSKNSRPKERSEWVMTDGEGTVETGAVGREEPEETVRHSGVFSVTRTIDGALKATDCWPDERRTEPEVEKPTEKRRSERTEEISPEVSPGVAALAPTEESSEFLQQVLNL